MSSLQKCTNKKRALFLADSQARYYTEGNLNNLSLPGAKITHAYDSLSPYLFDIIILFTHGNNAFNSLETSLEPATAVAMEIFDLDNVVSTMSKTYSFLESPNERKIQKEQ